MKTFPETFVRTSQDLCKGCVHVKKETEIQWAGVGGPDIYYTFSVLTCRGFGRNTERPEGGYIDLFSGEKSGYPFPLVENGLCSAYRPTFLQRLKSFFSACEAE